MIKTPTKKNSKQDSAEKNVCGENKSIKKVDKLYKNMFGTTESPNKNEKKAEVKGKVNPLKMEGLQKQSETPLKSENANVFERLTNRTQFSSRSIINSTKIALSNEELRKKIQTPNQIKHERTYKSNQNIINNEPIQTNQFIDKISDFDNDNNDDNHRLFNSKLESKKILKSETPQPKALSKSQSNIEVKLLNSKMESQNNTWKYLSSINDQKSRDDQRRLQQIQIQEYNRSLSRDKRENESRITSRIKSNELRDNHTQLVSHKIGEKTVENNNLLSIGLNFRELEKQSQNNSELKNTLAKYKSVQKLAVKLDQGQPKHHPTQGSIDDTVERQRRLAEQQKCKQFNISQTLERQTISSNMEDLHKLRYRHKVETDLHNQSQEEDNSKFKQKILMQAQKKALLQQINSNSIDGMMKNNYI